MPRLKRISALALMFVAGDLSASALTYAVGNCRPSVPSFPTIVAALAAVPSANVIEVCPGTYDEQLEITYPVTLEGVSNGTSARATIIPPRHGLGINATDDLGEAVAVQLWVNNDFSTTGKKKSHPLRAKRRPRSEQTEGVQKHASVDG